MYLFQCPGFENYRKQAFKKYFWNYPNVFKMDLLFNHSQKEVILGLVKFCKQITYFFDK